MSARFLLTRPGTWRVDLLWRIFGLSIFQFAVLYLGHVNGWKGVDLYKLQFLIPAGLLLVIFGGRSLVLALSWGLLLVHYLNRLHASAEVQLGEEYAIFLALPIVGIVSILVGARLAGPGLRGGLEAFGRGDPTAHYEIDRLQLFVFRAACLSTLLWATLHKINLDFFDPTVSCGPLLSAQLGEWWSIPLPNIVVGLTPLELVLFEALCVLSLILYPRIGILVVTIVIGVIGQRGATAFVMLAVGLSFAFLDQKDGERVAKAARRAWPLLLGVWLVAMTLSAKTYTGLRPWYEFMILQSFLIATVCMCVVLLVSDARRVLDSTSNGEATLLSALGPGAIVSRLLPSGRAGRVFVVFVWSLMLINGLSPYLGWKYRMSFAMLSNLRVDDARWNSLIFPSWLRLAKHDPFVHITRVDMDSKARATVANLRDSRNIHAGLFSPKSLEYRTKFITYHRAGVNLELEYKGKRYEFVDIGQNNRFASWLSALPKTNLIQAKLAQPGQPQKCTH